MGDNADDGAVDELGLPSAWRGRRLPRTRRSSCRLLRELQLAVLQRLILNPHSVKVHPLLNFNLDRTGWALSQWATMGFFTIFTIRLHFWRWKINVCHRSNKNLTSDVGNSPYIVVRLKWGFCNPQIYRCFCTVKVHKSTIVGDFQLFSKKENEANQEQLVL